MNILIIGNGGREFAIVNAFLKSNQNIKLFAIPGCNLWESVISFQDINILDFSLIKKTIEKENIKIVIVGPEIAIINGIRDSIQTEGVTIICPDSYGAKLEGSKIFSKGVMHQLKIPTAKFAYASNLIEYEEIINDFSLPIVLKSDHLASGKGVKIFNNFSEAWQYADEIFNKNIYGKDNKILIEEFLEGEEFSLICLINGNDIVALPPVCDHKTIGENDTGLMTGGMGIFNNPSFLNENDIKECVETLFRPIVDYFNDNEHPYFGFLFAGIMKVGKNEFKVIEYNVRLGDPETEIILPLIKGDFYELINDFFIEKKEIQINFYEYNSIGIVVSAKGYPKKYLSEINLNFLKEKMNDSIIPMGMTKTNEGKLISNGGRIFMYIKNGNDYEKLFANIHREIISFIPDNQKNQLYWRKDIGKRNLPN
ncbi:MAG: phosphoribosylamine--glycine ligase [Mycoplasmoidaceae bacterium]